MERAREFFIFSLKRWQAESVDLIIFLYFREEIASVRYSKYSKNIGLKIEPSQPFINRSTGSALVTIGDTYDGTHFGKDFRFWANHCREF